MGKDQRVIALYPDKPEGTAVIAIYQHDPSSDSSSRLNSERFERVSCPIQRRILHEKPTIIRKKTCYIIFAGKGCTQRLFSIIFLYHLTQWDSISTWKQNTSISIAYYKGMELYMSLYM